MTEKEYRAHPAISRSELWQMHESPEKFKFYKDNPAPPTPALLFGQVAHKLMLQPETFDEEFVVAPGFDRRTKDGKAAYEAFLSEFADKTIITPADYEKALEMTDKARQLPLVKKLLAGKKEVPFFWTDEDTGEECKCRVDCLTETEGGLVIVDYKTAANAKTEIFNNDIFKFGYYFQAAMYSEGVMHGLNLTERPEFIFIVQEKNAPYSVNIVTIPPEVMLAGLDTYREYMGIYHECNITGYWRGYTGAFDEPNEAFLPGWMQLGVEEEDEI